MPLNPIGPGGNRNAVGPGGDLIPHDERGVFAREFKPRMSVDRVAEARRDCVPCRAGDAARALDGADDPGGRVRVGLWVSDLRLGGGEDWQRTLVRWADRARLSWRGLAVLNGPAAADRGALGDYRGVMPVVYGAEGARALAARCDVVVQWAVAAGPGLCDGLGPRPAVVGVLHWNRECGYAGRLFGPGGVDRFVAVSELSRDATPDWYEGDVPVIWNAVDPARLEPKRTREALHAAWGVPPGRKVLGFLGRLDRAQKDPMAVARALPHLPPDWHGVVVGEGSELGRLESARTSLDGRLHLPGGDRDAGSVLAAFDALLVPSTWESFGLSLCEGLWCEVPVVATRVGVAKLVTGLVREIPVSPTGGEVAAAVGADLSDRVGTAARVVRASAWARTVLNPERFGREWTCFLEGISRARIGR